jgi:hypothetical protein
VLNEIICISNISKQKKIFIYLISWKAGSQANHQKVEHVGIYIHWFSQLQSRIFDTYKYISKHRLQISQKKTVQNISFCRPNRNSHKELLHDQANLHTKISRTNTCKEKNQYMQGEEQIITHISALESELELNEGLYLFQWENHIDEDREQQPQVVLQLGQGKAVPGLLVRAAGRSKQQGVCGGGIASCQRRQAPLYMVVTCWRAGIMLVS